jgi:CelD/BcsL family acetyltransferase involved in cellulose biosynthesis
MLSPTGVSDPVDDKSIIVRPAAHESEWNAAVAASGVGHPFARWDWLQTFARTYGAAWQPLLVEEDKQLRGAIPLVVRKHGVYRQANAWIPFPYVGPVIPARLTLPVARALRRVSRALGVATVKVSFSPDIAADSHGLADLDYETFDDRITFVVDISHGDLERLAAGYSPMRRRVLRKGARGGLHVEPATRADVVDLLPRALDEVFGRQGLPSPYPATVGHDLWDRFGDDPTVHMRTAHHGADPVGVLVAPTSGGRAFLWMGASLESNRELSPNSLLYDDLLQCSIERGLAEVDLVGTASSSMSRFKASFGAAERPFVEAQTVVSRSYSLLRASKGLARRPAGSGGRGGGGGGVAPGLATSREGA